MYSGLAGRISSNSAAEYSGAGTWAAHAYYLGLDPNASYPSAGPHPRWDSFPVRCLVILVLVLL